jgi:hypothetical protein
VGVASKNCHILVEKPEGPQTRGLEILKYQKERTGRIEKRKKKK